MMEGQMQAERVEAARPERFGEAWIHAIAEGALDRLERLCSPRLNSRVLTPGQFANLSSAAELVAKYKDWFAECTDFQVEASRVARIGKRLGISYRFLLRDHEDWFRIEQQLYCTLKDGRVQQLHLLCSGFQRVEIEKETIPMNMEKNGGQDRARDALLEFYPEGSDTASTCALLTPMIKARLGEMRSMQVLEVRVNDPAARGDVEAWSRLSGNPILKMVADGQTLRFFVQKK